MLSVMLGAATVLLVAMAVGLGFFGGVMWFMMQLLGWGDK